MESIVITLQNNNGEKRDLELPARVPISILVPHILEQLDWQNLYKTTPDRITFQIEDQVISRGNTLEDANIVDGNLLKLIERY